MSYLRLTHCMWMLCLFFTIQLNAQTSKQQEQLINPKTDRVTVFLQGAQLYQHASVPLKVGNNTVVFDRIPNSFDINSLQIKLNPDVTLIDAHNRTSNPVSDEDFLSLLPESLRQEYNTLKKNLESVAYDLKKNLYKLETHQKEKNFLENTRLLTHGGKDTLVEFRDAMTYFRVKSDDIYTELIKAEKLNLSLEKQKNDINKRLEEIQKEGAPSDRLDRMNNTLQQIVLVLYAERNTAAELEINYLVNEAGWHPAYDIRSKNTQAPLEFVYKAQIYQNTGMDWSDVKLIVSTNNPYTKNDPPQLSPRYLSIYQPYERNNNDMTYSSTRKRASTDQMSNEEATQSLVISQQKRSKRELAEESMQLNYAQSNAVATQTLMNIEYEIRLPQSIPSDGMTHTVLMKNQSVDALYNYFSVVRMDKAAFLLARVPNWGTLNLLAGTANLFLENNYVGKSEINPASTADTLLLSLGRDQKINVKSNKIECSTSSNLLKTKTTQTNVLEFSILNNKDTDIDLELNDLVPISQNEDVQVEVVSTDGGEHLKDYGKIVWKLKLKPNESRKIRLKYTVRYPYGKIISGL